MKKYGAKELLAEMEAAYEATSFEHPSNPDQLIYFGQADARKLLDAGFQCYLLEGRLCLTADIFNQALEEGAFN